MNTLHPVPTPHPTFISASEAYFAAKQPTSRAFPQGDPKASHVARQAKLAEWSNLDLRQDWMDEVWMRGHLRTAGVKVASNTEPATASRLRSILRGAGVPGTEVREAVGMTLDQFLEANPRLP